MPLILASASPRRADLLAAAGVSFLVRPAEVDETPLTGEAPHAYVERVARAKAWAVFAAPGDVVLGADTTVVLGERILGKPATRDEARGMLAALSGQVHDVLTGVVLRGDGHERAAVAVTRVRFAPLSPAELDWYVHSGEPEGKAGAYAIQGRASRFVEAVEGSYSNVVGLPVHLVYRLLREFGAAAGLAG